MFWKRLPEMEGEETAETSMPMPPVEAVRFRVLPVTETLAVVERESGAAELDETMKVLPLMVPVEVPARETAGKDGAEEVMVLLVRLSCPALIERT